MKAQSSTITIFAILAIVFIAIGMIWWITSSMNTIASDLSKIRIGYVADLQYVKHADGNVTFIMDNMTFDTYYEHRYRYSLAEANNIVEMTGPNNTRAWFMWDYEDSHYSYTTDAGVADSRLNSTDSNGRSYYFNCTGPVYRPPWFAKITEEAQ